MTDPAGLALPEEHTAIKDYQVNISLNHTGKRIAYWAECQTCSTGGFVCEGYSTRLHWNTSVGEDSRTPWSPGVAASLLNGDRIRNPSQSQYIWNKQYPGYRTLTLKVQLLTGQRDEPHYSPITSPRIQSSLLQQHPLNDTICDTS